MELDNEVSGSICLCAKYAIEMYWNMCNNRSEKTTGLILVG